MNKLILPPGVADLGATDNDPGDVAVRLTLAGLMDDQWTNPVTNVFNTHTHNL